MLYVSYLPGDSLFACNQHNIEWVAVELAAQLCPPSSNWKDAIDAFLDNDEFILDPTRITLICGAAGFDGTQFKNLLADRFDVQINKTSRNTVLVQTNINTTRSDAALLIKVLADLSRKIEAYLAQGGKQNRRYLRPK